jgi:hypothetical protein
MCARVGNQQSRGVVTARVRTDTVRSLRHQRRDLHQLTYPVPLGRSGLILLSQGYLNVQFTYIAIYSFSSTYIAIYSFIYIHCNLFIHLHTLQSIRSKEGFWPRCAGGRGYHVHVVEQRWQHRRRPA